MRATTGVHVGVTFLCARCVCRAPLSITFRQLYDLRKLTECSTISYVIAFRSLAESRAAAKEYADSLKRYFSFHVAHSDFHAIRRGRRKLYYDTLYCIVE